MFARLIQGLMLRDDVELYLLERSDAVRNIFRSKLNLPARCILSIDGLPLSVQRYIYPRGLPLSISKGEPYVFHSSYYRYCKDPLARNVTTLHDFTYEVMRLRGWLATAVHSWQKRNAVIHSQGVSCVSHATLADFRKLIGERHGQIVEVIPNAPLCLPHPPHTTPKAMNDLLYVGARAHHKNFKLVVDAISGTNWRLVLCSSTLTDQEYDMIRDKLLPGQYEICVFPDDATLSAKYERCRCLLYPSSYEGFGIPIIEAQLHGLPVITGNCPSSVEVGGNATLVLPEYTPQALRNAIAKLDDPVLYADIAERGRRNADRYNWQQIIDAYLSLYARVLCTQSAR